MDTKIDINFNSHRLAYQEVESLESLTPPFESSTYGIVDDSVDVKVIVNLGDEEEGLQRQLDPQLGLDFDSLEAGRNFYYEYAERTGFRARGGKCRTSLRDNSVIMKQYTCFKEGFSSKKQRHGDDCRERRNRASVREGCKAMIQLSRKDLNRWIVTKFVPEHTHPLVGNAKVQKIRKKRQVPVVPPELSSLLVDMSKDESNAVLGGGESFGLLEYLKMQQSKNPFFFYSVQVDANDHLTNVFWVSAESRIAYRYFSDVVTFDTTYKKNNNMIPFAPFTGLNNHLQPVIFGCALLMDDSEESLTWLFETFLLAMYGRHPKSFVTDLTDSLLVTVAKVFPGTRHRICKWQILSKCKEKLSIIPSTHVIHDTFKKELKRCMDESETDGDFESNWQAILAKYGLRDNFWMQSLYRVRKQWAKVYLKDSFFAELSPAQRSEGMNKFFQRNFETKATLREFIVKFDQAMAGQREKEVKSDFSCLHAAPTLKTVSPMERQAAETYTKATFTIFQEELVQSSTCEVDKFQDGELCKYKVAPIGGDASTSYTVTYDASQLRASCSCGMFVFSGILCRHILRIFSIKGVAKIPEFYFLKRWRKICRNSHILHGSAGDLIANQSSTPIRYKDLCLDVVRFAEEGGRSDVIYKVAKDALRKAFAEVAAARKTLCSNVPGGPSF